MGAGVSERMDRDHLEALLETYRRNLQALELRIARQGGADLAPIGIINDADEARRAIADLERRLALLDGAVEPGAPSPYPGLLAFGREQAECAAPAAALHHRARRCQHECP